MEVNSVTENALQELSKEKNYLRALELAEEFNKSTDVKERLISTQYRMLCDNKDYDSAYEWGGKYGIPKNEITNDMIKAFNAALKKEDVDGALECMEKYDIKSNQIIDSARSVFNNLFDRGNYIKALFLGSAFDMSRKRIMISAIKGYNKLLNDENVENFVEIEKKFNVLHDGDIAEVDEADIQVFYRLFNEQITSSLLSKNKLDELQSLAQTLDLFNNKNHSPLLMQLMADFLEAVVNKHNQYLEEGRGPAAFDIVKNFKLMERYIPENLKVQIIRACEAAHHKLLNDGNLNGAIFLIENYGLFNENILEESLDEMLVVAKDFLSKSFLSGDIESVRTAIDTYELDKNTIDESASKAIDELVKSGNYEAVFDIIKKTGVEIKDPETISEVTSRFHQEYEAEHMDVASNIAYYFKLKEPRAEKAALNYWIWLIEKQLFDKALALKKERGIHKKLIEPHVKKIYDSMIEAGQTEDAIKLRLNYRISLTFVQWVLENIKKMFKG